LNKAKEIKSIFYFCYVDFFLYFFEILIKKNASLNAKKEKETYFIYVKDGKHFSTTFPQGVR
jgi:hypothetical protein